MPQRNLPAGIERLLTRNAFSCAEPAYTRFRQQHLREWVAAVADAHEDGWELFRQAAIEQLGHDDPKMVDHALAVLFVVGNEGDAAAIEPLLKHANDRVRKAARTCLFELQRRIADG